MRKPGIPDTAGIDAQARRVLDPLKENVEILTGRRGVKIAPLPANPTNAQIATKLNELLTLLQG
jgi:hypothetical protein